MSQRKLTSIEADLTGMIRRRRAFERMRYQGREHRIFVKRAEVRIVRNSQDRARLQTVIEGLLQIPDGILATATAGRDAGEVVLGFRSVGMVRSQHARLLLARGLRFARL